MLCPQIRPKCAGVPTRPWRRVACAPAGSRYRQLAAPASPASGKVRLWAFGEAGEGDTFPGYSCGRIVRLQVISEGPVTSPPVTVYLATFSKSSYYVTVGQCILLSGEPRKNNPKVVIPKSPLLGSGGTYNSHFPTNRIKKLPITKAKVKICSSEQDNKAAVKAVLAMAQEARRGGSLLPRIVGVSFRYEEASQKSSPPRAIMIATSKSLYVFEGSSNMWTDRGAFQPLKQLMESPDVLKCGVCTTKEVQNLRAWRSDLQFRGFHDMGSVAATAGFNIRSGEVGLTDLCALLLRKRFKRAQKRAKAAAIVSRDVAIKLAPLWIPGACQNSSAKRLQRVPFEPDIERLPPVNSKVVIPQSPLLGSGGKYDRHFPTDRLHTLPDTGVGRHDSKVKVKSGKKQVNKAAIEAVLAAARAVRQTGSRPEDRVVGVSLRYGVYQKSGPPKSLMIATSDHVYVLCGFGNVWSDTGAFQPLKQLMTSPDVLKCGASTTEALTKLRAWCPDLEFRRLPNDSARLPIYAVQGGGNVNGCFHTLDLNANVISSEQFSTTLRVCSGFHDLEPVSVRAGFNIRSGGDGLQDLCALVLGKRVRRVQKRKATAATVSRDVAIKLSSLWIEGASQSSSAELPPHTARSLSEGDIHKLPSVKCNATTKVIVNAAAAEICVRNMLEGLRDAGGNVRRVVVGFDVKFVAAGALARTEPFPQLHLPTVIQVAAGTNVYVFHVRRFDGWGEGSSGKVLQPLKDLMQSSDIIKCGVNIENDVEILNACSPGLELRRHGRKGFQDLASLAKKAGFGGQGLHALCAEVLSEQLIKAEKTSNWGVEKLSEAQVKYAALDAWVAQQITLKLLCDLAPHLNMSSGLE